MVSEDEAKDKDEKVTKVRARTRDTMIYATKSGRRVRVPRTPLEGQKSRRVEADTQHGEPEKRIASHGGPFKEEDGTKTVTQKANIKKKRDPSVHRRLPAYLFQR